MSPNAFSISPGSKEPAELISRQSMPSSKLFMENANRDGPGIEPCGIPLETSLSISVSQTVFCGTFLFHEIRICVWE